MTLDGVLLWNDNTSKPQSDQLIITLGDLTVWNSFPFREPALLRKFSTSKAAAGHKSKQGDEHQNP